jgi:hypothetical protein
MSKFLENPETLTYDELVKILKTTDSISIDGCDSYDNETRASRAILKFFPEAKILEVHDLRGRDTWDAAFTLENVKRQKDHGSFKTYDAICTYVTHRDYDMKYNSKCRRIEMTLNIRDWKYDFGGDKRTYNRVRIVYHLTKKMYDTKPNENAIGRIAIWKYKLELESKYEEYLEAQKKAWISKFSNKLVEAK